MIIKQKATLYKKDGTKETIDDISSYYYHLKQVAEKIIRELELLHGMDDSDIRKTITQMNGLMSTRESVDDKTCHEKGETTMHQSMKDALRDTIEDLRSVIHRIATKENANPAELAVLPEIANSITRMTGYARIEP